MAVSEEMVERAYNRFMQANAEVVDCPRCKAKGYHHGFGEDGHDPDWCENCGGPGTVSKFDEMSAMREALTAALSDQVVAEPYLVWSNQHRAWWRPNSCGYTIDVRAAGHYSREEAISISGQSRDGWGKPTDLPDELAIPLSALPKNIRAAIAPPPEPTGGNGEDVLGEKP